MYFIAEYSGELRCRLMCNEITGRLVQYKDIPYSKLFGFIADCMFEAIKEANGTSWIRDSRSMIDLYRECPIEYAFIYKNNKNYNQGISADESDFNLTKGKGYGEKPSAITRLFHKQIIIIFKFINNPSWIKTFKKIWLSPRIFIKNAFEIPKKTTCEKLSDIRFDFDKKKPYYCLNNFSISIKEGLNPNKMLYMFNANKVSESIYVDNIIKDPIDVLDIEDFIENIVFQTTTDFIGE